MLPTRRCASSARRSCSAIPFCGCCWAGDRHESESELLLGKLEASEYVDFDNEVLIRLQKAIIGLPDKQRLVFNMRYYDDLSYEEISAITGSSVQTLKTNYHYAKEKIKDCILNG